MNFGHKKMYIGGELMDTANNAKFDIVCPGDESIVGSIAWAGIEETQLALIAAQEGFEYWSKLSIEKRNNWILKLRTKLLEKADLLRSSIMHEMGKSWQGTLDDITSITDSLAFYSEEILNRDDIVIADKDGTHEHKLVSQPLGVVVAFLAYNFPLLNLGYKLGPALASGCSIILKPSEYSPLSAYIVGEICYEMDFPKGVINILCGDVTNVGIPLCESTIPKLITMIGATETAQKLIQQSSKTSIKRYSMECGGNAPFIVFEDADIDKAVEIGAALKTGNSGQICVAPNRFFIQESVFDLFVDKMKDVFSKTQLGFGKSATQLMGPLANRQSVNKVKDIVRQAIEQGGELLFGGNKVDKIGYYYEPTIVRVPNGNTQILQEEIFGPVILITSFKTKEEVLEYANSTDSGLASYVFSKDKDTINFFSDNLEFGEVQVNGVKYAIYLPHGGIKNSGIGVDCSTYALDDYLIKKRISKAI